MTGLVVDNFAGGGGASTGIEQAIGRAVDIGMRMLEPRELANAMGLPRDYILNPICWYRTDKGNLKYGPLPKAQQIAKIGNMVCPGMARALVGANQPELRQEFERLAA